MNPQIKKCGVCDEDEPIGMSIMCWPEGTVTHVCVDCCITWFPTYLSLNRRGIDCFDALREMMNDVGNEMFADGTMFKQIHFDPSSLDSIKLIKKWLIDGKNE